MNRKELIDELEKTMSNTSSEDILLHKFITEALGLSITDSKSVDYIVRFGPLTAGKLADLTGLTTGAITGVIDRLEKAGFAKRTPHPTDRRVTLIEVVKSDGAGRKVKAIYDLLSQNRKKVIEGFSDKELDVINKYLTLIEKTSHEVLLEIINKKEKK